jgi:hypothetical protein
MHTLLIAKHKSFHFANSANFLLTKYQSFWLKKNGTKRQQKNIKKWKRKGYLYKPLRFIVFFVAFYINVTTKPSWLFHLCVSWIKKSHAIKIVINFV